MAIGLFCSHSYSPSFPKLAFPQFDTGFCCSCYPSIFRPWAAQGMADICSPDIAEEETAHGGDRTHKQYDIWGRQRD